MNKKLLSILALSMLLVGCQDPQNTESGSQSETSSTPSVESSLPSSTPSESTTPEPVLPEKISVSGNVSNLVDGNLSGVAVKYNGLDILTDNEGKFSIENVADYQTAKLSFEKEGYLAKEVAVADYFTGDEAATIDVSLAKPHVLIGTTIDKTWGMYGKFSLSATRDNEALYIQLTSLNTSWLENEVPSWAEVYISTGMQTGVRADGHYMLQYTNQDSLTFQHFGETTANRNLVSYNGRVEENATIVDIHIPFEAIGVTCDDVIGLTMGEWNESEKDWAPMASAIDSSVCPVETPKSYVRIDKSNAKFANEYNCKPEDNPKPKYTKEELIVGYPINFAVTGVAHALADDIYVKYEKTDSAFVFDMIGFGSFADNEYIKTIIHSGNTANSGWNLGAEDITIIASKTSAKTITGQTNYWYYEDNGRTTNGELSVAPEYKLHQDGYFTYKLTVPFANIPNYDANQKYSVLFVEHGDQIYNDKWDAGMFYNGVACGDAADQSTYIPIQKPEFTKVDAFDAYPVQFAINYNDPFATMYADFEKDYANSTLKVKIGGYGDLPETSFIRFILKDNTDIKTAVWEMAATDMSFTIYKNKAYYQTGHTWFWDNERNTVPFTDSPEDTTVYTPVYTHHPETNHFTLEFSIDFSETGIAEITAETTLRGLLILYAPSIVGGPVYSQNGIVLGDPANQLNYLTI